MPNHEDWQDSSLIEPLARVGALLGWTGREVPNAIMKALRMTPARSLVTALVALCGLLERAPALPGPDPTFRYRTRRLALVICPTKLLWRRACCL